MRTIQGILFGAVAVVAVGIAPAFAADLPARTYTKAPPAPIAVAYNWSGFYIGADVGAIFDGPGQSFTQGNAAPFNAVQFVPINVGRGSSTYVVGGAHAGYNWQTMPNFVVGIEGDWMYSGMANASRSGLLTSSDGVSNPGVNLVGMANSLHSLASVRGRLGYAADNWLFYGTGGVAFADQSFQGGVVNGLGINVAVTSIQSAFSSISTGWVAGGGIEWAPWRNNWLVRAEYLYYGLPTKTSTALCTRCTPGAFDGPGMFTWSNNHFEVARVGLSYKFGGPIVAKY